MCPAAGCYTKRLQVQLASGFLIAARLADVKLMRMESDKKPTQELVKPLPASGARKQLPTQGKTA
jgi:hypothetical protein